MKPLARPLFRMCADFGSQCDLQLPACKNCRTADVECLFWDDTLEQEVSCRQVTHL